MVFRSDLLNVVKLPGLSTFGIAPLVYSAEEPHQKPQMGRCRRGVWLHLAKDFMTKPMDPRVWRDHFSTFFGTPQPPRPALKCLRLPRFFCLHAQSIRQGGRVWFRYRARLDHWRRLSGAVNRGCSKEFNQNTSHENIEASASAFHGDFHITLWNALNKLDFELLGSQSGLCTGYGPCDRHGRPFGLCGRAHSAVVAWEATVVVTRLSIKWWGGDDDDDEDDEDENENRSEICEKEEVIVEVVARLMLTVMGVMGVPLAFVVWKFLPSNQGGPCGRAKNLPLTSSLNQRR